MNRRGESPSGRSYSCCELPVVIQWPGNHHKGMAQVMFYGAERHVQLMYPGKWLTTEAAIRVLIESDTFGKSERAHTMRSTPLPRLPP